MLHPHLHSGPAFSGLCVGLLGGSFNPAHGGHLAISLYALKNLGLDQVWWLVSPQNPLKSGKDMAPLAQRLKQARAMVRGPRMVVSDLESQLGTRYSVDTLRALRRRFRHTRFVWLMGADNVRQMPAWRKWPDIFRLVPVAVFRRPAYSVGRRSGKVAQRFDYAWLSVQQRKTLARCKPPAWLIMDNPLNDLSSTYIRQH